MTTALTTTKPLEISSTDNPGTLMRWATDVAGVSREIVLKTAVEIQGRKYVKVEGWQAIAVAHGCVASSRDVEKVPGGYKAIGEVRRMSDGVLLAQAEGFIGEDEPTWFGGESRGKTLPKRAEYAIRAMCQTRAISRACRSAFAHVVVMIDSKLSTTPAEEVPDGGFIDVLPSRPTPTPPQPAKSPAPVKPSTTAATIEAVLPKVATAETLKWFLQRIEETTLQKEFHAYAVENGILLETEDLADWPLDKVPTSKQAFAAVLHQVEEHHMGKQGLAPINQDADHHNAEWYNFPLPFGKQAGVTLGAAEKNYLFGLWANYTVETEYNGKPKKPETIAKDTKFREMLDAAGTHYGFEKKD